MGVAVPVTATSRPPEDWRDRQLPSQAVRSEEAASLIASDRRYKNPVPIFVRRLARVYEFFKFERVTGWNILGGLTFCMAGVAKLGTSGESWRAKTIIRWKLP